MVSFIQRQTRFILGFTFILTLIGGYYTVQLYKNLRTDLEELLPTSSRSVKDLDVVASRLRSIDNLAVLVFSKDINASRRFMNDLATEVQKLPETDVASMAYRINKELAFFKKRQALYIDLEDLNLIDGYLRERLEYEKALYNPLNIFSEEFIPEPYLDFEALQAKYSGREAAYSHFPDGYFASEDETIRVMLIDVPGKSLGIEGVTRVKNTISATVERLKPQSYSPEMTIHYSGSVQEMLEEQEALVEDLEVSTIIVLLVVTFVMLVYFRTFFPTMALLGALLAGTFWTFGISFWLVGYLNANSAFLGGIVIGNGINFGIIYLARYLEERRRGRSPLRATRLAILKTYKATLTAAAAAGLAYGSLGITDFRGFAQFGIIGLIGMALCWIAAYTILPALLAWWEYRRPRYFPPRSARFADLMVRAVEFRPRTVAIVSGVLTLISLVLLAGVDYDRLLETNLANLRSKRSEESGAAYYSQYLNQIFKRFLTPIVILPKTRENALEIAARMKEVKRRQGASSPIVNVQTIDDFLPGDQKRKISVLKGMRRLLPERLVRRMDPVDRERVHSLLAPEAFREVSGADLPELIRTKFTEKDGSIGKLVLVEPPLSKEIWKGSNLNDFIATIRNTADEVEAGAPVAGGMVVSSDLIESISRDGPRATLLAILAAVLLVVLLFRDPRTISLALFALFMGVSWFGGLIVLLADNGFKINFLNFVALPITFGIGVDYGVNVFQRYRVDRKAGISAALRETGGAVSLSSLTTIIGYGSLLIASNRGFVSFGLLAVLGEFTCGIAALFALPCTLIALQNLPAWRNSIKLRENL